MPVDVNFLPVGIRLGVVMGDTPADPDRFPDVVWCDEGAVRLNPLVNQVTAKDDEGNTVGLGRIDGTGISAHLDSDGWARWEHDAESANHYTYVVDLTDGKTNPTITEGATHTLSFDRVKWQGNKVSFQGGPIRLTADRVDVATGFINLLDLLPAGSPVVIQILEGPVGPAGPNTVPTETAVRGIVATDIATPDSAIETALSANFLKGTTIGIVGGQIPVWDATAGKFIPGDAAVGAGIDTRLTAVEETALTVEQTSASVALAGAISTDQVCFIAPYPSRVDQVSLAFGGAVAGSGTDYWTVTLRRYRGGVATVIGTKTSKSATNGEPIAAYEDWNFDLTTFANNELVKGDILTVTFAKTGTPADLVTPVMTFRAPPFEATAVVPLVFDSFNRSAASLGVADSGQTWTSLSGGFSTDGAEAVGSGSASTNAVGLIDCGQSDYQITVKITNYVATGGTGLVFGYVDADTYYYTRDTRVFRVTGGSGAGVGAVFSETFVSGDTIRVIKTANDFEVQRDAGSTGSFVTVATSSGFTADAPTLAATVVGIRGPATATIDNFQADPA